MAVEKVRLTTELAREKEKFLTTFHAKVLDSRGSDSILGDTFAAEAAAHIDLDLDSLKVAKGASLTVPMRAKHLDTWAREYLAAHPSSTVLHLGCGLDSRVYRIDPPPTVRWYDVDRPEVIELRRRVYPERHDHAMIGTSVTDLRWLDAISADRPVLVIAEGLVMYLSEHDGVALLRRIAAQFPSGQLIFDAYSRLTVRLMMLVSSMMRAGLSLSWAIDDPRQLETQVPALRLVTATPFLTIPELVARLSRSQSAMQRRIFGAMTRRAWFRRSIQHLRYEFALAPDQLTRVIGGLSDDPHESNPEKIKR